MEELHLFVYGEIGGGMFSEGSTSAEAIQKEISENPKAKEVIIHISSPGGSVFEGWTIGNILKNSGKKTTAKIEGFCASIATYIALSCDSVEMAEVGRFLIHNPSIGIEGEEGDLEKAKAQLGSIKDDLIATYRKKTGLSVGQLSKMMDEETTFTAVEAKQLGFVDAFMTPIKAVAYYNHKQMSEKEKAIELVDAKSTELNSVLDKLIAKGNNLMKTMFPVKNMAVELADGGVVWVESEDGEFEGKPVFIADEEGNPTEEPAPDGVHALTDGRSITVEDGVVVSVEETEDEVEALKNKIAELEAQNAKIQEETAKAKNESEETIKAQEKSLTEILDEVKNLKKMTAGSEAPIKKAIIEPKNKFTNQEPVKAHPLDAFANSLKSHK